LVRDWSLNVTVNELLAAIFSAKRLEDLQNEVRNKMIRELIDTSVDNPILCCPQGRFPEVDGVRS
jgi:hypothetical protein